MLLVITNDLSSNPRRRRKMTKEEKIMELNKKAHHLGYEDGYANKIPDERFEGCAAYATGYDYGQSVWLDEERD
jgi:hypothetical protein